MTNKEVIEQLKWVQKRICDITYSPESFEAIELAINALKERPQGKWIKNNYGEHHCNKCSHFALYEEYDDEFIENASYFCPFCGADMRGDKE